MNIKNELLELALAFLLTGTLAKAGPLTNTPAADKVPYARNLDRIKRTVEILRGKKFQREVPAFMVSANEMEAISDRDLEKDYPGEALTNYQALMIWMDMLPPGADLKKVEQDLFVGAAAGFYDTDTKEMCIPSFSTSLTNALKKTADKKMEQFSAADDDIIFAHEFTHALEDQYWPLDDPNEITRQESTDRGEARSFLAEGSATRLMIEAVPALYTQEDSERYYPQFWNAIHAGICEFVLGGLLQNIWKSPDALVPGVPEQIARSETMEYSYGYAFCSRVMRHWGLDGLDYFCDHPPASTAQIIHPEKAWEWRDLPERITLPQTLPHDWKQVSGECLGEAGISIILGCAFQNLNRGAQLAGGWEGDRAALYESSGRQHLLIWASSWDSDLAAAGFASAWIKQRQALHKATIVRQTGEWTEWTQPNGRAGKINQNQRQVLIYEADQALALGDSTTWAEAIGFAHPPENALRAAANSTLLRINPLFSWQQDADYTISRSLWGLLSRHDRNSIGKADRLLLGLLAESHRTANFHKWELGWSMLAKHDSDSRRGLSKTGLLPWSVLYSQFTAELPDEPVRTLSHKSSLWGLAFSQTADGRYDQNLNILPAGILFRKQVGKDKTASYILGTGFSRSHRAPLARNQTQFRLLGIPVWTKR